MTVLMQSFGCVVVKEFKKWSIFDEDMNKSFVSCFFDSQCMLLTDYYCRQLLAAGLRVLLRS